MKQPIITPRETFGTKLRRLANTYESKKLISLPPWKTAAAWASNTAYVAGDVVASNGNWYVAATSGTSGSVTAPAHVDGQTYWDGSGSGILWLYLYPAPITSDDANAPTISTSSSAPTSPYLNIWYPGVYPNLYTTSGCYPEVYASNYWNLTTFNKNSSTKTAIYCSMSFMTDAQTFTISTLGSGQTFRILIDDRYIKPSAYYSSSSDFYVTIDFSSTTKRKPRKVTLEVGRTGGINFRGLWTKATDMVWPVDNQDKVTAAFIADSLMAGSSYGTFLPGYGVTQRISKNLGWSDPWAFVIGGTGYTNNVSGTLYTYGQRIPEALTRSPDIWVFMGSTNDYGVGNEAVTAAALASYRAIRAGGSTAPIVVFGVWPLNDSASSASSKTSYIENAVQAAVTQFNDPHTFFIPIRNDPILPWVTGSWNNTGNTVSNNSSLMIAGDNTHPGELGIQYLAERLTNSIRKNVLPNIY